MTWKLNVKELLHFFDVAPDDSAGHASALVGIIGEELCTALLQKYFKDKCGYLGVTILMKNGRPATPTLGTKKGQRLDRWLCATNGAGEKDLYQIEIKNWSAHAIGGKALAIDASHDDLRKISEYYWQLIWDSNKNAFRNSNAGKVLTRMRLPQPYEDHKGKVIPLLCFWWYITSSQNKNIEPLFNCKLENAPNENGFKEFQIFSVSNYLRLLCTEGINEIDLEMPQAAQRITWIKRIFGSSFSAA